MKMWGGRFEGSQDALAAKFNNSLSIDWRLGKVDVRGSKAWAEALGRAGILTESEVSQICQGLDQVFKELDEGGFEFQPSDEDIHTAVERRLGELVGPPAGKLHTGRSRNDQVVTDFRLWVLEAIEKTSKGLKQVQQALVNRAESDWGILLPGYTHLQRAQPVLLSHWWLSHFWPLQRDLQRLNDLYNRCAVLPLGASALAGTPFQIDRLALADALDFKSAALNSIDAVSDRDFAVEFLFCAALISVHLSRLSEMLVLFSTAEFGFVELADAYTTGSSLMPQKKNPDPLELARGKAGTLIGSLAGLLAALKSTPSAYDKDLQEDKQPVFQAADTLDLLLPVMAGAINTLTIHPQTMRQAMDASLLATDLADYLVRKDVPFREAHRIVGQAVRRSLELGVGLDTLPLADLQALHAAFQPDVLGVFQFEASIARRSAVGGTSPDAVQAQLNEARRLIPGA